MKIRELNWDDNDFTNQILLTEKDLRSFRNTVFDILLYLTFPFAVEVYSFREEPDGIHRNFMNTEIKVYDKVRSTYKSWDYKWNDYSGKEWEVHYTNYVERMGGTPLFSIGIDEGGKFFQDKVIGKLYYVGDLKLFEEGDEALTRFVAELNGKFPKSYIQEGKTGDLLTLTELF